MAKKVTGRLQKTLVVATRFEFVIPDDVPRDKIDRYTWGKLIRICRGLSKNGLKVIPVVPEEHREIV